MWHQVATVRREAVTGAVCIITDPEGHVFATAVDTDQGAPAGLSVTDAQKDRAGRAAWRAALFAGCNADMARAVQCFSLPAFSNRLVAMGWKETFRTFGVG